MFGLSGEFMGIWLVGILCGVMKGLLMLFIMFGVGLWWMIGGWVGIVEVIWILFMGSVVEIVVVFIMGGDFVVFGMGGVFVLCW